MLSRWERAEPWIAIVSDLGQQEGVSNFWHGLRRSLWAADA